MPMIIVRVVKTVEFHVTDRISRRGIPLVFDSNFDEEFCFIIWIRQDERENDLTFFFMKRPNG
tara:strand:+ start:379 stop:567 length:189 start_codon:yes stop_codon:yes gene_type:complete